MADAGRPPWEMLDVDSTPAFHAFTHYRDLAPSARSLLRAWQVHYDECDTTRQKRGNRSVAPRHWERWSPLNSWVVRAAAWDVERDRILRVQKDEHRNLAYSGQRILARNILSIVRSWISALAADPDRIARLTAHQVNILFETASKTERLLTGITETVLVHPNPTPQRFPEPVEDAEQEPLDDEYLAQLLSELDEVGVLSIEGLQNLLGPAGPTETN